MESAGEISDYQSGPIDALSCGLGEDASARTGGRLFTDDERRESPEGEGKLPFRGPLRGTYRRHVRRSCYRTALENRTAAGISACTGATGAATRWPTRLLSWPVSPVFSGCFFGENSRCVDSERGCFECRAVFLIDLNLSERREITPVGQSASISSQATPITAAQGQLHSVYHTNYTLSQLRRQHQTDVQQPGMRSVTRPLILTHSPLVPRSYPTSGPVLKLVG